ncbi:ice-binding family protein [Paenarthrobacter sp. Z7-10]|uniref:ice-binding family protein n=1 Tax=Paenarthrobacter sp. Z7-10 TaxID=2787635 RepID=UPI003FA78E30
MTGTLTLDARGDPSVIFIFKANSFTAATNSAIRLVNGASASNIYWRIAGPITLGTDSTNIGNYLAATNATLQANSQLTGRLVSLSGSITITSTDVALP